MYAVVRTGGKQYRVAPGDVVKIESVVSPSEDKSIEFSDVLAVSSEPGSVVKPGAAKVTAEILGKGRGDKIPVFHASAKQYRSQGPAELYQCIKAIEADGVTYTVCAVVSPQLSGGRLIGGDTSWLKATAS
jgi:large subunit ribosomal protein L21